MKTLLFFIFFSLYGFSFAQFSESFFERMSPSDNKIGHYFGTEIQNGALAVRFADSVNTEVQWAKLDLQGNYQTFSANLPADYISPNERIIEVFESGINQFIVTQDSASNNLEGIYVYKFQNYTQSAGVFSLPVQLRNGYFQSYFKYGKIYVFFMESNFGMRRLKIDPTTLALEENLFLGAFDYDIQDFTRHYKKIHVLFQDANNMQIFCSSGTSLIRINVVNNISNSVESKSLGLLKVLGVNHSKNQVICLFNQGFEVKKYNIVPSVSLSNIILGDSIKLPIQISLPNYFWKYTNDDFNREVFVIDRFKFCTYDNNLIISEINYQDYINISHVDLFNGNPLVFGNRLPSSSMLSSPLFIAHNQLNFKEYRSIYNFGNYNVKFGVGLGIIPTINDYSYGNFLFSDMVYYSGFFISGKGNNTFFGENNTFNYKPGPYTNPNQYNHNIVHAFNESFYVDVNMLNYHKFAIATNVLGYQIPYGILHWPAHGDISLGQSVNLAPFIDVNQNGVYEPTLGEFPSFPGTHCLLNITHQNESDFQNTGLGLEIHSYMYNFDCNDTISDVVFLKSEIYNRSSRTYDSLAFGIYNDFDLGYYSDDYIGTHVENGLVYCFNADGYDDPYNGRPGFQDSLPSIANMFLKGVKCSNNSLDDQVGISSNQTVNGFGFNDGIIDNEYKALEYSTYIPPNVFNNYSPNILFNNLNGLDQNGVSLYYCGTNYPSRYFFPDSSDSKHYGTNGLDPGFACSEVIISNQPGDRRILGSFGSTALNSGDKITYHSAYLAGKRMLGMGQSQIDLFAKAAHVKKAFNSNLTSCGQSFDNLTESQITFVFNQEKQSFVSLYPNPSASKINFKFQNFQGDFTLEMIDINGKTVLKSTINQQINSVDVNELEKGIYFVRVSNENLSEKLKFIKN